MAENINLLPQRKLGMFSEEKVLAWTKIAAVSSVVIVFSLSILFFLLSRDPAIAALKSDQSRTLAQLNLFQDRTAKYLIVVDRITRIKTILKQRGKLDLYLSTVLQQIPPDVSISNLAMDAKILSLTLTASNLSRIGIVTDSLVDLVKQKSVLKNLTIQGIVTDEKTGSYSITLTANIL